MAFCVKCGTTLSESTTFCGKCGTPVTAAPIAGPAPGPQAGSMTPNVAAALSYLVGFITGIIFLVLEPYKNDRFVRFHAFQSIFYSVTFTIFWYLWSSLIWFGLAGWALMGLLGLLTSLIGLAAFLFWLFLMYKAYNNEKFKIPVLGDFAERQAG